MSDFRNKFIAAIQYGIDQLPCNTVTRPVVDAAALVRSVEIESGILLSSDVSDERYTTLQRRLSRAVGFGSLSGEIIWDIITTAFLTASRTPELIESKAILFGLEYRQILNSLKPSMGKRIPVER